MDAAACSTPGHASALRINGGSLITPQRKAMVRMVEVEGPRLRIVAEVTGAEVPLRYVLSNGDHHLTDEQTGTLRERCP